MRVLCTLPHCSSPINGWVFAPSPPGVTPAGWVSEALSPEQAAAFLAIPGYAPYFGPKPGAPEEEEAAPDAPAAALDAAPAAADQADPPLNPAPARRTRPRTPR